MSHHSKPSLGGPYRILVVDDEPDLERLVRQRMRRDVRKGKFRLSFAHNGVEALEQLSSGVKFDLVLSDINMPRMDGLTLLDQIPHVDPDLRAVIVSAYGDMGNIRTAMNRGAFDFVTKPIDFKDLRVTIDRTLRNLEVWREALNARDRLVAIESELTMARRIQSSILPIDFPEGPNHSVFGRMDPAKEVGGDFFDVVTHDDGRIGLAIADVSGKGIPAALFMMSCRTLLKGATIGGRSTADVLDNVNRLLAEENSALMFVTLLYAIFDPADGSFVYSSGGHDPPLVVRAGGSAELLQRSMGGIALGVQPEWKYRINKVRLDPGDTVLLYTDGITEAQNVDREQFGAERLRELFVGDPPGSAEAATERVFQAVADYSGDAPQFDDVTCVAAHHSRNGS